MCRTNGKPKGTANLKLSGTGSQHSSGATGRHSRLERSGEILDRARTERCTMLEVGAREPVRVSLTAHFWPSSGEDSDGPTVTLSLGFDPSYTGRMVAQQLFGGLGSTGMVELRFRDSTKI